jgi:glycerol-3-phosphate O-acyltransferase
MKKERTKSVWWGFDNFVHTLGRRLLFLWVRTRILPKDLSALGIDPERPMAYALESRVASNILVLEQVCLDSKLPSAMEPIIGEDYFERHAYLGPRPKSRRLFRRKRQAYRSRLARLMEAVGEKRLPDVQIVPVQILWGRSPDKEQGFFKVIFSDTWSVGGRIRRLFAILLHGRNTTVQISRPVSVQELMRDEQGADKAAQKLDRVLRVHFRRLRTAAVGPDLSHRRTMMDSLLGSPDVTAAIEHEASTNRISTAKARQKARKYADEIAADYSYAVIRLLELVLGRLWNRIYEGVEVHHLQSLREVAPGNELVYLPSHRSHIDYLLLSYLLHEHGLVPPHIAAGINLNLPVVGPILRRGGAFFIRRRFSGNRLYATVFNQYLSLNLSKGVSIEFFPEGGRSRTGRLLNPRTGMLAMTVNNYLRNPDKPLVLIPIYVGYETLFEGRSYVHELSGKPKRKESLFDLFRALRALRGNFGKVHVGFGEPIHVTDMLERYRPGWREQRHDERPEWLNPMVNHLGQQVMTRINNTAAVNPINLLALVLLAAPRHAIDEQDLADHLETCVSLLKRLRYSSRTTVTELSGRDMIRHGERLNVLVREDHPLGPVISLHPEKVQLMSYYRNNILHLFALPSVIAVCFVNNSVGGLRARRVVAIGETSYPFLKTELFLRWQQEELGQRIRRGLLVMAELGLLQRNRMTGEFRAPTAGTLQSLQLSLMAQCLMQSFERFYITMTLLAREGSGKTTARELENLCQLTAQRLAMLYGFNSPEFFDRTLFQNHIAVLKQAGYLSTDEDNNLLFSASLAGILEEAELVLSEPVRHSIMQITRAERAA